MKEISDRIKETRRITNLKKNKVGDKYHYSYDDIFDGRIYDYGIKHK